MRRRANELLGIGGVILIFIASISWAEAGISRGGSSFELSRDGTRILAIIHPRAELDEGEWAQREIEGSGGPIQVGREMFPSSGVFDAETFEPIWHFDWDWPACYVRCSADMSSIVMLNQFALRSGNGAIKIIKDGQLLRQYSCDDLLKRFRHPLMLPFTTADYHTMWYGDFADIEGAQFNLSTAARIVPMTQERIELGYQEHYTFDLETGEVLSVRVEQKGLIAKVVALAIALILLGGLGVWTIRRWGRRRGAAALTR